MKHRERVGEIRYFSAKELPEVPLLEPLNEIADLLQRTCEYLFKGYLAMNNPPLKGFLLEGIPGTGKTEIIKQVARNLDRRLPKVFYVFVDGGSIASPRWGDAEKKLASVFELSHELKREVDNPKMLILFDDIESLMMARGAGLAKEWHYSINSILFHEIDRLDPSNTIVFATTNRPDLVDEAIRTRLYPMQIDPVEIEVLIKVVDEILKASKTGIDQRDKARNEILSQLQKMKNPTIRDARQITVMVCMKGGMWRV